MTKEKEDAAKIISDAQLKLVRCRWKATVLKACFEIREQEKCFPGIDEHDEGSVYSGMSQILSEIMAEIDEASGSLDQATREAST
jgi:hypothetical protein